METTSLSMLFFLSLFTLVLKPSLSETILVDGVAVWRNPSVLVGDTIIFRHKQQYNLYIFHNKRDFKLCNFTQAILLTHPNSNSNSNSYTWHPSRPGFFYFLFNNASSKTCQESEKLPIKVSLATPSPELAPSPSSGASSPAARQWRIISPQPSPATTISPAVNVMPGKGGNGMPFINSNPAVPLPNEADSASLHPIPVSGDAGGQMVGLFPLQAFLWLVVLLMFS